MQKEQSSSAVPSGASGEPIKPGASTARKKLWLFRQPRWVRATIYIPLVLAILFYGLRQLEFLVTFHPRPYLAGPYWTPPTNGEDVRIKTASGERLHGWFINGNSRPPVATVLYCHGNGGDLTDVAWIGKELSKQGIDVLVFDYRGYGRSDGKLTGESALYSDTEAAYEYLLRQRGVKPESLVVYGQSLGTTVAIDLAARRPCAGLIVESGLSSASAMGKAVFPWLPVWLHFLGKNRFESARKIAQVKCPVLITHGTADNVIPVAQGQELYAAAHDPKQLIIVAGGDHNLFSSAGKNYSRQIFAFINEAVKPKE